MNQSNDNNRAAIINDPVRYMITGDGGPVPTRPLYVRLKRPMSRLIASPRPYRFAFAGLLVFTTLLYLRPHEMFAQTFGNLQLVRIVAIITLVGYLIQRLLNSRPSASVPIEMKMIGVIFMLGMLFTPIASAPQDSIDVLLDLFIKVVAIFVLMINVINTRARLRAIMALVVMCGTVLAILAIKSYLTGDFKMIVKNEGFVVGMRIFGPVGGIVGNPNDLAISLDLLLPLAVALALTTRGLMRAFYLACGVVLVGGVVVTFSRGGFLGLMAMGGVLLWKVGRRNRAVTTLAFIFMLGVFTLAMPGGYAGRISSIFNMGQDPTGSSQARRDLLERAAVVAFYHPFVGVGMGNYHIYSIGEQVSHNSYLEVAAELGLVGLAAYLVLIFAPLRSLRKIERETETQDLPPPLRNFNTPRDKEIHYLSIALQAVLMAYIVCSFFGSIQYQWFLYYPVAYAIALRRIHYGEQEASSLVESPARAVAIGSNAPRGVLWKRYQKGRAQATAAGAR
jgi:O-antigen ligase